MSQSITVFSNWSINREVLKKWNSLQVVDYLFCSSQRSVYYYVAKEFTWAG
jgi:hypothetical protein